MSEKLSRVTASEIIKVLEKSGFVLTRQSGSHRIYKNEDGARGLYRSTPEKFFILKF